MQRERRVPNCSAGRLRRSAVGRRRRLRQMVKVWILIQREGVVLNRRRRYKKEGRVGTGSQCAGINSADARAQIYYMSETIPDARYHDEFLADAITFAVDVDGVA
jgi:hypothetical protein